MEPRALVFASRPGDAGRAGRTLRSLRAAGIRGEEIGTLTGEKVHPLMRAGAPLLLVRAGAWLVRPEGLEFPRSSATGKGLCALGALRTPPETEPDTVRAAGVWQEVLAKTGGDLGRLAGNATVSAGPAASRTQDAESHPASRLWPAASLFLDPIAVSSVAQSGVSSIEEVFRIAVERFRVVHFPPLDVHDDPGLRVLQVITSLQRGGAERMALDLVAELAPRDVRTRLAILGRASRETFPAPRGTLDLSRAASVEARAAALARAAIAFGADLVHGHLVTKEDLRRLSAEGFPVLATIHNARPGWPAGLTEVRPQDAALLVACAQAVEADLRAAKLPVPIRTVWNGINLDEFRATPQRQAAARKWRQTWGFGANDFILIAVANPRPQKRLHLLPAILAALQAHLGPTRPARLVFCGESLRNNREAEGCVAATRAEIARLALEPQVRWVGSVAEVSDLLAAADALVSTSAHEGLSLAQLEALAVGCPVVTTDVGGAREIALDNPNVHLVPRDAPAGEFARALSGLVRTDKVIIGSASSRLESRHRGAESRFAFSANWSRQKMAERYRWLYPRALAAARRQGRGSGLWLITNNFSTGGAQTSARRLLVGLARDGVPVRAAVVEEDPDRPTPGRRALLAAGLPVLALPPADWKDTSAAVGQLLSAIDDDPPQTVLFWNLRPSFKVLLADALLDVPVFDVSPGEMFFDSLNKFFAQPVPGFPYRTARDYGARLAGVIVKYHAEAQRAAETLGAPVHVIPNGVPLPGEASRPPAAGAPVVFGTAARINPQKRLEDLLEALHLADHRLPAYTLKIAGGVERGCEAYAARLRTLANGLPVEWLGEVSDIPAFYRDLDLFLMISEPAGCPNASLEALAAGLPVIATDAGGAAEQVIEQRTGCLVPSRSPQPLADALVNLAAQPELRRQMGTAARGLVRQRFGLERMIADYRRVCLPGS